LTTTRVTEPALRQIDEIYHYIALESLQGAENVVAAIYAAIDLLALNPRIGRQTPRRNTRMYVVTDYPYLIFFSYLRRQDELRVMAVRHAARRRIIELREDAAEFHPPPLHLNACDPHL
jgi:plasmid stabilization system protein ParE